MDYNEWIELASNAIQSLQTNTIFFVKDLFQGTDWNNLPKGERLGIGRFFKNEVINNNIKNVEYIGKASNNSAQYRKL